MTIKTFIEKAISGGFADGVNLLLVMEQEIAEGFPKRAELLSRTIFLKPKAWQAVGKVERWCEHDGSYHGFVGDGQNSRRLCKKNGGKGTPICSRTRMHAMIDALAEGSSLEEFIKTL